MKALNDLIKTFVWYRSYNKIMRSNNKVKAVLSVNPSFNMEFINDRIYHKQFLMDNIMTEMKIDT